ncbi:DUF4180 domain-containing protein [Actinokineospora bangkokensis]|uniref:Alpha/beta hydrolase n=1 Tax=Actinokineospora bangkokensis TaxID=1193682 RepID=A0A1Q9LSN6_9PSEU|nr:DUF4180 domain-containing protein [Actinokineospora bangkokensis]OLR95023.1 alpha/beta hydrolase [Actinokineospora bangkokensis]
MIHTLPPEGPPLTAATATDVIGGTWGTGAEWVVVPVSRLDPEFFRLSSGVAGEITQKFANYRLKLAVVGDIEEHLARSAPLRDLVREANAGSQLWFAATEAEFTARLRGATRR